MTKNMKIVIGAGLAALLWSLFKKGSPPVVVPDGKVNATNPVGVVRGAA